MKGHWGTPWTVARTFQDLCSWGELVAQQSGTTYEDTGARSPSLTTGADAAAKMLQAHRCVWILSCGTLTVCSYFLGDQTKN